MMSVHEDYLKLLSEFEALPRKVCSESIFDIAGYPHYENVASNIMAFFLNPNNEHGLGELMLSSLLNLAAASETNQSNVQVSREVHTMNGGRLDILIETDNQLVGVENKIYHHVANNLVDYSKSIDEWAQPNKLTVVKVILGIKKEQESSGFISVTYEELFSKVKERLGSHATTSSQKWLLYLVDFISAIEKLKGNDMEFDENDKFFIKNEERINCLVKARSVFLQKLNRKVIELQKEIEKPDECKKQWIYEKLCLVHDFDLSGNNIALDLHVSPAGWNLQLFGRDQQANAYATQLLSNCSGQVKKEKSKYELKTWPLSTGLAEIKIGLCDWMGWIVREDADKSPNRDAGR